MKAIREAFARVIHHKLSGFARIERFVEPAPFRGFPTTSRSRAPLASSMQRWIRRESVPLRSSQPAATDLQRDTARSSKKHFVDSNDEVHAVLVRPRRRRELCVGAPLRQVAPPISAWSTLADRRASTPLREPIPRLLSAQDARSANDDAHSRASGQRQVKPSQHDHRSMFNAPR